MSTTVTDVVLEDATSAPSSVDSRPMVTPTGRGRAISSWVAVAALGVAAVVLTGAALGPHRSAVDVDAAHTIAEHGSISAIDHRDELVLRAWQTPGETVAEHGSVSATDHRDALAGRP